MYLLHAQVWLEINVQARASDARFFCEINPGPDTDNCTRPVVALYLRTQYSTYLLLLQVLHNYLIDWY